MEDGAGSGEEGEPAVGIAVAVSWMLYIRAYGAGGDEEARDAAGRDEAPWGADHDEGVRSWRATVVSMFLELPATANARILGEAE